MGLSQNINNYRHVFPILDAALANNGGTYKLLSKSQALRWRMEAYQYRKLLSAHGPTKYDDLVLSVNGASIKITIREIAGIFVNPVGEEIKLNRQLMEPVDDLEAFALQLATTLEEPDEEPVDEGDGQ